MKKMFFTLLMAVMCLGAKAQFEQGKYYIGASLSGLQLSYSKATDVTFGLAATGGYFVADQWMLRADFGYHTPGNSVSVGAGARYYIAQNGIFLGAGLEFEHAGGNFVSMPIEAGYCFFLNQHVALEPAIYYAPCFNNFSDGSSLGLKIGFAYMF